MDVRVRERCVRARACAHTHGTDISLSWAVCFSRYFDISLSWAACFFLSSMRSAASCERNSSVQHNFGFNFWYNFWELVSLHNSRFLFTFTKGYVHDFLICEA